MKFRTTLVLLALVLGLGAFYACFTLRQPDRREYREQRQRLFAPELFPAGASGEWRPLVSVATAAELRDGNETVALTHTPGKPEWRIVKPFQCPADLGVVAAMLNAVESLSFTRALPPEKGMPDLAAYGLAPARRALVVHGAREPLRLDVGESTPDGAGVYVRSPTYRLGTIFVISKDALAALLPAEVDLRDKAALRFNREAVTRVELRRGDAALELRRSPTGWRLAAPVEDEADGDAVARLFRALAGWQIDGGDFLSDDPARAAEFGLDRPALALTLHEGETRRALWIGGEAPGRPGRLCARREAEATLFALPGALLDALPRAPVDLRDRAVAHFRPEEITALAVTLPERRVRLTQAGGAWQMDEPPGAAADPEQVKRMLNDLRNLLAKDWIDAPSDARLAEAGLDAPPVVVSLSTAEGARSIRFGKPTREMEFTFARRGEAGPILIVSSDVVARLATGPLAFLSRRVMEFKKEQAESLRLERPDGTLDLIKRDGRWRLGAAEANAVRVDDLLWGLSYVEAKQIVAERPAGLAPYGLDRPRLRVTVATSEEADGRPRAAPRVLLIGGETDGGAAYAMMENGDRVYTVGKPLVDQLMMDYSRK